MSAGATAAACSACHPGSGAYASSHRDGQIKLSTSINNSPLEATYRNLTSAFPQTITPSPGSCSNVNCHFEQTTPVWGSTPLAAPGSCNTCHGFPPSDGSHPSASGPGKKHGDYYGTTDSCGKCHPDHASASAPFGHATGAGKRGLDVSFLTTPNNGGSYSGVVSYPAYLPSQNPDRTGTCTSLYCHSDGRGGTPNFVPTWGGTGTGCIFCHKGRVVDSTQQNCGALQGAWSSSRGFCTPSATMASNGHERLVGLRWIRKYPCTYCHYATFSPVLDANGKVIADGDVNIPQHLNGEKNVAMAPQWNIPGKGPASYDPATKKCDNVYCHSDGTTNPDSVRSFGWQDGKTKCNTCHGHTQGTCSSAGCHDGHIDGTGKTWTVKTGWPSGEEWKEAIPMFTNQGPGTDRANSHMRHAQTNFTCDQCHAATIINGACSDCHVSGVPSGSMSEVAHLDAANHANKRKDVVFRRNPDGTQGSYSESTKTCTNVSCHSGGDPQWGGSVNSAVICLTCHGAPADVDSYSFRNFSTQAKINMDQWFTTGHGRPASKGPYPVSGNPAANFPGNPCWYCHDNTVIHNDPANPFRLRQHQQFSNRFQKECVYCHMIGLDSECRGCHDSAESLAPQLATLPADPSATWPDGTIPSYGGVTGRPDHAGYAGTSVSCLTSDCHFVDPATPSNDLKRHNTGAGLWQAAQLTDIKNQYVMMGVCLKCHDDDSGGKCTSCHVSPSNNPFKYTLGFDPGTGFIKPQKARATSVHFGYKHFRAMQSGVNKGGKFCWDCHDPHGDTNIYMIHSQVATTTDGTFGIPKTRAAVVFTQKQSGLDYARISAPYNGICNVCHAQKGTGQSKHYGSDYGDGHNAGRVCTTCHEHRFTDSHAENQPCNTCHRNKPVPRHSAFGQPRDCTKCHAGTIGMRMDIMGQMNANSHHVQGTTVTGKHCYSCHWESTPEGLIDVRYHLGYNYKTYTSVKNAPVSLVVWKPGQRPTYYNTTTAVSFRANAIGTPQERAEVAKLTTVCLSCHSDQNNTTQPFGDCKTPRQYAWDGKSVAARYSQTGTTAWGKYNSTTYPNANQKDLVVKALSAHGNAAANQGGFDVASGTDSGMPNTRNGSQNVQCFDCHNSHGSKVTGVTSSYVTFNGTRNGANLKETQAGKGGYAMSYKASAYNPAGAPNPYNAGAGLCFDCHLTQTTGTTPWGYQSTFGASQPIKGYYDSAYFGPTADGPELRFGYKGTRTLKGGHLKASGFLNHTTSGQNKIDGLCTPCHDPHGVSPTLGARQAYAVPLLKGTWMTSPYREDAARTELDNPPPGFDTYPTVGANIDQNTFGGARIGEDESKFAGLCMRCHAKGNLTNGTDHTWKSRDRIHESVRGWKTANSTVQHSYVCSKCHTSHASGLPRLMVTNCLDTGHRGRVVAGGQAGSNSGVFSSSGGPPGEPNSGSFPKGPGAEGSNCHPNGTWPDNSWNSVTPW